MLNFKVNRKAFYMSYSNFYIKKSYVKKNQFKTHKNLYFLSQYNNKNF